MDAERLRKWLRRVDGFDRIKGPEARALLAALDCAEALHKWSRRWSGEPPQDVTDQVSRALAAFRRAMEEKP